MRVWDRPSQVLINASKVNRYTCNVDAGIGRFTHENSRFMQKEFIQFQERWNFNANINHMTTSHNLIPHFCHTLKRFAKPFSTLCVAMLLLILNADSQNPHSKARLLLKDLMQKEHIPGLAYAVVRDGKIETMGTLGKANIPFNQSVTNNTAFQQASCSKIFCSLLLGKLFDKQLLKPDQTLGQVLDSVPDGWKKITILQLAAHQSGIRMADFSKASDSRYAYELARQMPLDYEPGSKNGYMSSDYWVLQYIIERVTNMKYFDALRSYVLEPLNLEHTFVNNPKIGHISDFDIIPEQAQEYHWFPHDSTLRINQMWFPATGYAAGGIYSSIEDLATIAAAFDKGDFLSAATKELITTAAKLNDGKDGPFGLGLIVRPNYNGHKLVEHSGGPALADFVRFDKEKLTFIVLTNNRGTYPYLAKALATLYIDGLPMPEVPKDWQ